jgi:hypothetical protein
LLFIAQFTYNSYTIKTTKVLLFFANYGFKPKITKKSTILIKAKKAITVIKNLFKLHKKLSQKIKFVIKKIKVYYDKNRFENVTLKKLSLFIYT